MASLVASLIQRFRLLHSYLMILDLSESIMWLFLLQWRYIADFMVSCSAFSLSVFVSRPVVSFSHSF